MVIDTMGGEEPKRLKPLESMGLGDLVQEAIGLKIAIEDLGGHAQEKADTYMDRYLEVIRYLNRIEYKIKESGIRIGETTIL